MLKSLFVKINSFVERKFGKWFFWWFVLMFALSFYFIPENILLLKWAFPVSIAIGWTCTLPALLYHIYPEISDTFIGYLILGMAVFLPILIDIKRHFPNYIYRKYKVWLLPIVIKYMLFFYVLSNTVFLFYLILNNEKCNSCTPLTL